MGEHYFSEAPASAHDLRSFTLEHAGRTLQFQTDAGVFSREHLDKGTALLLRALPDAFAGAVLDLGCGWGPVGVCLAARWPQASIVMTDINERAVALSCGNLQANGLRAEVVQGDGLTHLSTSFDLIATNPPIRAGKAVVLRLLEDSLAHLTPDGALYVVMRKQQGAESAQKHLQRLGAAVEIVERGGGFRVFRATRQSP